MPESYKESAAVKAYNEVQGMPVETTIERANKALAAKDWLTAHILFAHASKQAIVLSAHCIKQELDQLKGAMDGNEQED